MEVNSIEGGTVTDPIRPGYGEEEDKRLKVSNRPGSGTRKVKCLKISIRPGSGAKKVKCLKISIRLGPEVKKEERLEVSRIERGIVIDHIRAGSGMKVLEYLDIGKTDDMVALIMNASSEKHRKKDIIKIENITDVDVAALGLLDHTATVNIIENGETVKKIKLSLPERVSDVIKCKNPRCVTSVEPSIPHIFHLVDAEKEAYRCEYCDEIVSRG